VVGRKIRFDQAAKWRKMNENRPDQVPLMSELALNGCASLSAHMWADLHMGVFTELLGVFWRYPVRLNDIGEVRCVFQARYPEAMTRRFGAILVSPGSQEVRLGSDNDEEQIGLLSRNIVFPVTEQRSKSKVSVEK
jgi:hypothetical protein